MSLFSNRIVAVGAGAAILAVAGTTGAVAANMVTSANIKDGSIRAVDVKKESLGTGVIRPDFATKKFVLNNEDSGSDVSAADNGDGTLTFTVDGTEYKVVAAEEAPVEPTATWSGQGASVTDADTLVLDSRGTPDDPATTWSEADTAFASADETLAIEHAAGDKVSYTWTPSEGAEAGWGAPRLVVTFKDGSRWSTIHNTNPDYGTDNGDGSFTVETVLWEHNANAPAEAPAGTIVDAALVYDNQPKPGVVTFEGLTIAGQSVPFSTTN